MFPIIQGGHQHSKSSHIALLFTKLNNRISQLNVDKLLEIFSYLSVRDCIRLERGLCIECFTVGIYIAIANYIYSIVY